MKTYARIENGVVAETLTTEQGIVGWFHPALLWVDATGIEGLAEGWRYDGTHFAASTDPAS